MRIIMVDNKTCDKVCEIINDYITGEILRIDKTKSEKISYKTRTITLSREEIVKDAAFKLDLLNDIVKDLESTNTCKCKIPNINSMSRKLLFVKNSKVL